MTFSTVVILASDGAARVHLAKAIREEGVYTVILPCRTPASAILEYSPAGILIPASGDLAEVDPAVLSLGLPVLCFGEGTYRVLDLLGGSVAVRTLLRQADQETVADCDLSSALFAGGEHTVRLHAEVLGGISSLPAGFRAVARTDVPTILGAEDDERRIYGLTVNPGENPSPFFRGILRNFLFTVCRALPDYTPGALASELIARIREKVGSGRLLTALYPSVASVTSNALLARALPGQVTAICVDTGLMRENETEELSVVFEALGISLVRVDAGEDFLSALDGAACAACKDTVVKQTVGRVFREAARELGHFDFFSLGRICEDVLSLGENPAPDMISHAPEPLCTLLGIGTELIPTAALFESETRTLGALLGLPRKLTCRRYYPLAGVAIRINGVITREKIALLRGADRIVREELERSRSRLDKFFVALLEPPHLSDGVRLRDYYSVAIVTARYEQNGRRSFAHVPHPLLSHISDRITSELPAVKRVFFDITNDPSTFVDQIDWM